MYTKNNRVVKKSFISKTVPPIENKSMTKVILPVYPAVIMIIIGDDKMGQIPNMYYINDNKLYQNNNVGLNPTLVNGNYQFMLNDILNTYSVINGEMKIINSYFDIANNKLIIKSLDIRENGMIILTDDMKIYINVNNLWTKH